RQFNPSFVPSTDAGASSKLTFRPPCSSSLQNNAMIRTSRLRVEALEDRLAPAYAGTLDPTYGVGGEVFFQNLLSNTGGQRAAVDPSGRVVVAYDYISVTRFTADGTADESFGTHGTVELHPP